MARVAGFGRTVVFGRTVGGGCVGAVYQTANTVPNIIFDIVAGGTLAALVVPLLAPAFAGRGRQVAAQALSALLTWTLLVMTAVAVGLAALAGVLTRRLVASAVGGLPELLGDGARMVRARDVGALDAAVRLLLTNPRADLAERGRARAADWPTPDDTVTQVAAVYQEVTGVAG